MRPNPLSDLTAFLFNQTWQGGVFAGLLVASLLIALLAFRRQVPPPGLGDIGIWLLRVVVGALWWQQSLWKLPPRIDGMLRWMGEMVEHSAIPQFGDWVRDQAIPNVAVYGKLAYGINVAVAVSLILGLFTRLGALLGLVAALVVWIGLYSAPNEWPWAYGLLIVIQALWVIDGPGRSLGLDAIWAGRRSSKAVFGR